jgi:cell wall-associated NlpC family hydrolase
MSDSTLTPRAALLLRPLALVLGMMFASIPLAHAEDADATANAALLAASLVEAADRDPLFDSNIPDVTTTVQFDGSDANDVNDVIPFSAEGVADQGLLPYATRSDAQDPIAALFARIFFFSPDKELTLSGFDLESDTTVTLGTGLRIASPADSFTYPSAYSGYSFDSGINNENSEFSRDFSTDDAENYGDDDDDNSGQITYSATRKLLDEGLSYLGIRYRTGGRSRETGFDCSGLVLSAFRNALGLDLPHSSRALASRGTYVSIKDLRPGDLVFFNVTRRVISHVGIYVGEGKFLHSPSTGRTVRIDTLSSQYWARRYATARRVLDENPFDLSGFESFVGPPEPGAIR